MLPRCLQEPSSIEKVAEIDEHIGCAMSGLTADAKTLIDHARADTQVWAWDVFCLVCLADDRPDRCHKPATV